MTRFKTYRDTERRYAVSDGEFAVSDPGFDWGSREELAEYELTLRAVEIRKLFIDMSSGR